MALAEATVPMPSGQPYFRFCDENENRRLLGCAGFDPDTVVIEEIPLLWRFHDLNSMYEVLATATTRSSLVLAAQSVDTRRAVRDTLARGVAPWVTDKGGFALPHVAVLVTAFRAAD